MVRLFAPPVPHALLPRTGVTAGNLVLHLLALAALLVPLQHEVRRALLDREVIYLVPYTEPGGREPNRGDIPLEAVAQAAGALLQGAPAAGPTMEAAGRGEAPELSVTSLKPAFLTTRLWRENALTELEVDSTVQRDPASAAPAYPPVLLQKGLGGAVTVRYVVDTLGGVDTLTYQVLSTTHPGFATAVRVALPAMRFRPAIQRGRRVRQWVEQTFRFRIVPRDTGLFPP